MNQEENIPKALRIIGTPVKENGQYVLHEYALTNRECGWICPRCNMAVEICPAKAGRQTFTCGFCRTKFLVQVVEVKPGEEISFLMNNKKPQGTAEAQGMTPPPLPAGQSQHQATKANQQERLASPLSAQLVWGSAFNQQRYCLRLGANIIGRKDDRLPSDLEFNDPEMSRRSVRIDVHSNGDYVLTVLKALNPVTVDGLSVPVGNSIRLAGNAQILLGKTILTFMVPQ